jgi:hypothetical protein
MLSLMDRIWPLHPSPQMKPWLDAPVISAVFAWAVVRRTGPKMLFAPRVIRNVDVARDERATFCT